MDRKIEGKDFESRKEEWEGKIRNKLLLKYIKENHLENCNITVSFKGCTFIQKVVANLLRRWYGWICLEINDGFNIQKDESA